MNITKIWSDLALLSAQLWKIFWGYTTLQSLVRKLLWSTPIIFSYFKMSESLRSMIIFRRRVVFSTLERSSITYTMKSKSFFATPVISRDVFEFIVLAHIEDVGYISWNWWGIKMRLQKEFAWLKFKFSNKAKKLDWIFHLDLTFTK